MITVYKKNKTPKEAEIITGNDVFFNKYTSMLLDERAASIIKNIDQSEMISKYMIGSRFDGTALNTDKLSTGCKTALNILYYPDKIFDIAECGDNALDVIYAFEQGNVCCDYPMIAFDMTGAYAYEPDRKIEFDDYDELKEWWLNED